MFYHRNDEELNELYYGLRKDDQPDAGNQNQNYFGRQLDFLDADVQTLKVDKIFMDTELKHLRDDFSVFQSRSANVILSCYSC